MERVDERADVFGILHEFDVAEGGGDALGGVHRHPALPPIGRLGPQAVLRVDDERRAREPGGDPAEDAGLRVVCVHDVGSQLAEQPHELAERSNVVEGIVRPGERGHVDVVDAHRGEVRDVWARRRHPDHFVAGGRERA